MKLTLSVVTAAALAGSLATAADITGKVKLTGTPPPEKPIALDPTCGKMHEKPITTRHYVVGEGSGLANVFVYVKEGAKPGAAPAGKGPVLDQVGCEYSPYVMGVQAGQHFDVRNSDALLHNVHALPKNNKERNVGQPVKGMVSDFVFDKPEVLVKFKCDVHPWMFAYVGVAENPYYAVTDKDGNFKISGLPAGDYTIEAYHLKAGAKAEKVTVGAENKTVDFALEAKAAAAPAP
jgi:plastocyanin